MDRNKGNTHTHIHTYIHTYIFTRATGNFSGRRLRLLITTGLPCIQAIILC